MRFLFNWLLNLFILLFFYFNILFKLFLCIDGKILFNYSFFVFLFRLFFWLFLFIFDKLFYFVLDEFQGSAVVSWSVMTWPFFIFVIISLMMSWRTMVLFETWMKSFHDCFDSFALTACEETQNSNDYEHHEGSLDDAASWLGLLHLHCAFAHLANSHHFEANDCGNEENTLKNVVKIKFISGDVLALFRWWALET